MAVEVTVEVQGMEDGSDVHESRPQNIEVQVDIQGEENG